MFETVWCFGAFYSSFVWFLGRCFFCLVVCLRFFGGKGFRLFVKPEVFFGGLFYFKGVEDLGL